MAAAWAERQAQKKLEELNRRDPNIYKRFNRYFDAVLKSRSSRALMTAIPQRMSLNAGEWFWKKYLSKSDWGLLPKEYDKKIHGVYCPWRYYGKKDTNFWDVKIGQFSEWYARRDKSPRAIMSAMSRGYYKWVFTWFSPRLMNMAPFWQIAALMAIYRILFNHDNFRREASFYYH